MNPNLLVWLWMKICSSGTKWKYVFPGMNWISGCLGVFNICVLRYELNICLSGFYWISSCLRINWLSVCIIVYRNELKTFYQEWMKFCLSEHEWISVCLGMNWIRKQAWRTWKWSVLETSLELFSRDFSR